MSDFLRYTLMRTPPTREEVAEKIRDCRTVLKSGVHEAPLCRNEALDTAEDFSTRYFACMECHQAVSGVREIVGYADSDLREAFAHIDGVLDACAAMLGADTGKLPPPVPEKE